MRMERASVAASYTYYTIRRHSLYYTGEGTKKERDVLHRASVSFILVFLGVYFSFSFFLFFLCWAASCPRWLITP